MEKREQQSSSKKARVEGPGGRQDAEGDAAAAAANGAAGAMVPTEAAAARAAALTVQIDMDMLHCPRCNDLFTTPIFQFQCEAGHLACGKCHADLPKDHCYACGHAGGYVRCVPLEKIVGRVRILCPYEAFGCETYVLYSEAEAHQRQCPFAPCGCPERGCPFHGTPAALRAHLTAEHPVSGSVVAFRYGVEWNLTMRRPAAKRQWKVLFGHEDGGVFLVSMGAVGAGAAVTVVCVRANGGGAAATQYACNVAMDIPAGGGGGSKGVTTAVMAWKEVGSSALTGGGGAPAPDDGVFFGANAGRLLAAGTVSLRICIDPIQVPAVGAARAAASAATPMAEPVRIRRSK
ncbi:unnamed protein product [Urochloa humidicola]